MIKTALSGSTVSPIFHGVLASSDLGLNLDASSISKSLSSALKKDDSLLSLGQAFYTASYLPASSAASFFDRVEDAIVQADEVDNKMLQFEGGLTITNVILTGALKLGAKLNKSPPVTKEQIVKFANYFLSRKSVQGVKGAAVLLEVIDALTSNNYAVPVAVTLASPATVSEASPKIRIRVSNLFGAALNTPMSVTVQSAQSQSDKKVTLLKNAKMSPVAGETSLFEIDMKSAKPVRGFYTLTVTATPSKADNRLVGNEAATLEVKVLSAVSVDNVQIGVVDADQSSAPKLTSLTHPNKMKSALEADRHHKVLIKFSLKDKDTGEAFQVHQTFVKLTSKNGEEIIFLAEADKVGSYKFELDVTEKSKEFGGKSGKYSVELIIGDAVISNPIVWNLGDLSVTFPEETSAKTAKTTLNAPKPEIRHVFRQPEVRPPGVVSNTFTILCLVPIFVMFALWGKLGVNIGDFPFSLSAIGFHLGLGAIFGLYYYFWVQLNMFTTMKYLLMLGVVTFLCGNSMLVKIAEKRKVNH